jgi:hypothetical protein
MLLAYGRDGRLALAAEAKLTEIEPGEFPPDVLMRKADGMYETRRERLDRMALQGFLNS